MISVKQIKDLVETYDKNEITIGALGSHSALDIADGAKDEGFKTIVICQKGREKPYLHYKRIFDEVIILDKFKQIAGKDIQEKLRQKNTIFIPHRSFTTYVRK